MVKRFIFIAFSFLVLIIGTDFVKAKSRDFVDYVSLYNQASKPEDYNLSNNAAQDYLNAKEVFKDFRKPEAQQGFGPQKLEGVRFAEKEDQLQLNDMLNWSESLSEEKLQLLRKWVSNNTQALEFVHSGSMKPYYWMERESKRVSVVGMLIPHLGDLRDMVYLLCCRAKLEAIYGNVKEATKDIVAAYRLGDQLTGPKTMIEQKFGTSFKSLAIKTALMIIDNVEVNEEEREFLLGSLLNCTDEETFEPDLLIMSFLSSDCLQRMYILNEDNLRVQDKKESRRQITQLNLQAQGLVFHSGTSIGTRYEFKFTKMDYSKAEELLPKGLKELEDVLTLEAYQLNKIVKDEQGVLQRIQKLHPLLNTLTFQAINVKFSDHERLRARIRGLKIIMGVLKFQDNTGKLPANLTQLQEAGLLQEIPIDPFSGKGMKYKKLENGFTVYSYGLDFSDDNGQNQLSNFMPNGPNGDLVIWPVENPRDNRY